MSFSFENIEASGNIQFAGQVREGILLLPDALGDGTGADEGVYIGRHGLGIDLGGEHRQHRIEEGGV